MDADTVTSSLINPNQLRAYGITVQDNPLAGPMYISNEEDEDVVSISMFAEGTNISINTRTPTQEELDTCRHITLTSDTEWEPNDIKFPQVGAIHRDASMNLESDQREIYNVLGFSQRLIASCRVQSAAVVRDLPRLPTFQTEERRSGVTPEQLADHWMIGLETARHTLKQTTQCFLRSALLPLSRRYKADRMYRAARLQGEIRCKSRDGNKYGQIFANEAYLQSSTRWTRRARLGMRYIPFVANTALPRSYDSMVARNKLEGIQNSNGRFGNTIYDNIYLS
jgi:hypothetical protein